MAGQSLRTRVLQFGRDMIVGGGASAVDFAVLTLLIRCADVLPTVARLPALLAGATVQFFGSRTFTFHAQRGSCWKQALRFVVCEAGGIAMNVGLYRLLQPHITVVPPEIVSFLVNFIVTIVWAYPMRKLVVFRVPQNIVAVAKPDPLGETVLPPPTLE